MDLIAVLCPDQILHLLQLLLQLLDASVIASRCDPTLQDLLHGVLDVLQVPFILAHYVIPQLEAWVTLDTTGEVTGEAPSTFITLLPLCSLLALTLPCYSVTLGSL